MVQGYSSDPAALGNAIAPLLAHLFGRSAANAPAPEPNRSEQVLGDGFRTRLDYDLAEAENDIAQQRVYHRFPSSGFGAPGQTLPPQRRESYDHRLPTYSPVDSGWTRAEIPADDDDEEDMIARAIALSIRTPQQRVAEDIARGRGARANLEDPKFGTSGYPLPTSARKKTQPELLAIFESPFPSVPARSYRDMPPTKEENVKGTSSFFTYLNWDNYRRYFPESKQRANAKLLADVVKIADSGLSADTVSAFNALAQKWPEFTIMTRPSDLQIIGANCAVVSVSGQRIAFGVGSTVAQAKYLAIVGFVTLLAEGRGLRVLERRASMLPNISSAVFAQAISNPAHWRCLANREVEFCLACGCNTFSNGEAICGTRSSCPGVGGDAPVRPPVQPKKVFCHYCGFSINPIGHEQRCGRLPTRSFRHYLETLPDWEMGTLWGDNQSKAVVIARPDVDPKAPSLRVNEEIEKSAQIRAFAAILDVMAQEGEAVPEIAGLEDVVSKRGTHGLSSVFEYLYYRCSVIRVKYAIYNRVPPDVLPEFHCKKDSLSKVVGDYQRWLQSF